MTNEEFERRVTEVMRTEGLIESEARLKVSIEAGDGGDVVIEGKKPVDPLDVLDSLGDSWKPIH